MPITFIVFMFIWETGMLGSMGEVASTVIIPMKPEHRATPFASMLTPAGTACKENGLPRDHSTGGVAVIGAMLYVPMAVKRTMPLVDFIASAEAGDIAMLCNWRLDIIVDMPPQEMIATEKTRITREKIEAEVLRIDTSK